MGVVSQISTLSMAEHVHQGNQAATVFLFRGSGHPNLTVQRTQD